MRKVLKKILLGLIIFLLIFLSYLFIGKPPQAEEISWGVNFSQKHSENLGISWKENYLALLDDLKVKNIKLITHWNLIEPEEGKYNFDDLDWQIQEAENRKVNILLVIGIKTGRWPECHIPEWAKNLSKEEQQKEILEIIKQIVLRYGERVSVNMWQVENEPFFPFGECPRLEKEFLKKEIDLVKILDPPPLFDSKSGGGRPVIISDSGEFSFWIKAANLGDIVGTTLHRKVWFTPFRNVPFLTGFKELGFYISYPFNPTFYWRRAEIIKRLFDKEIICVELQAEPWCPTLLYDCPLEEQRKTMNLEKFQKNIEFAKKTGLDTFYLWGAEWWYWLKSEQDNSSIWNEARKLWQ